MEIAKGGEIAMTISKKDKKKIIEGIENRTLDLVKKALRELSEDDKNIIKEAESMSRERISGENYPREEVLNERERCLLDKMAEYLNVSTEEAEEIFINATKKALLTAVSELQKDP